MTTQLLNSNLNASFDQAFEALQNLEFALNHFLIKSPRHYTSGTQSFENLSSNSKEIPSLVEKAHLTHKAFMRNMVTEHSDAFMTDEMTLYLEICQRLLRDIPLCLEKTSVAFLKDLRISHGLLKDLQDAVLQIEEQRDSYKERIHWSPY